jgi:hypothetical protein
MRGALVVALGLGLTIVVAAQQRAVTRPESAVGLVDGRLTWGPIALGMSAAEVEKAIGQTLVLEPNVDDTSPCSGLEASPLILKQKVTLTIGVRDERSQLIAIRVALPSPRELREIVAGLKTQVPALRFLSHDASMTEARSTKPLYVLEKDPQQGVLVDPRAWLLISRSCWD